MRNRDLDRLWKAARECASQGNGVGVRLCIGYALVLALLEIAQAIRDLRR